LSAKLGDAWQATLSHEALELVADPESNLFVQGPNPRSPKRDVFHWFEMCDAVQSQWYEIAGVPVSDFVLPLYFTREPEAGSRNNFLGVRDKKTPPLKSFGVAPGGYIGYYDPKTQASVTYDAQNPVAKDRQAIKSDFSFGRRQRRMRSVRL
jgi:hypothetical protein